MLFIKNRFYTSLFLLIFVVTLGGCSSGASNVANSNAANVQACTEAAKDLRTWYLALSAFFQSTDYSMQVLSDVASVTETLSSEYANLADTSSGDVSSELKSASIAASNYAEGITSIGSGATGDSYEVFTGIVSKGGTLDLACQAAGSMAFSPEE